MKTLLEIFEHELIKEPNILNMEQTQVQIDFTTKKAVENFSNWFNKEGFDLFTKSKYNKLTKTTDDFVTCLATDEKMDWGHYYELQ